MKDLRLNNLEKFEKILSYRKYADNTKKVYVMYATKFLFDIDCPQSQINGKKINEYFINYTFKSISQQSQYTSAIKLYAKYILKIKNLDRIFLERPRKEKSLPVIVDKEFMISKINSIKNLKHKSVLALAYSTGMRKSEIANLKIEHVDSKRMIILVSNSKFNKSRYVPLSVNVLSLLRVYYKKYRPKEYLFNGENSLQYSNASLTRISNDYLKTNFHKIRHSALTAMLENGTDFRILQKVAGHSSSKTTEIYAHVSTNILSQVKTPI